MLDAILDILSDSSLVEQFQVEERDETPEGGFLLQVRCHLTGARFLQVRVRHTPALTRYAYQLFTDHPILRWGNVPHYPHLDNYPHHFHEGQGVPVASDLTGDPVVELPRVLGEIALHVAQAHPAPF